MVTTFNGGGSGLIKTLAVEIAPHRVNGIHPGVVGDSPKWRDVPAHPHIPRAPIGRLVTMDEVAEATEFLLGNGGINAHDLAVDGGLQRTTGAATRVSRPSFGEVVLTGVPGRWGKADVVADAELPRSTS